MIFEQEGDETRLLAILDWQTFKIGNPLIDIATVIGANMSAEDRREHTPAILRFYTDEMRKRQDGFRKRFEMTVAKAETMLATALRWPCIQTLFAAVLSPKDDFKDDGEELGRLSKRLKDLMGDVIGK